jgi:short-subunit dehydrogenase
MLFNNAGVAHAQLSWKHTSADWQWLLGVNLMSVVHAHRHFIPRLLAQTDRSHIVNTASAAGLISPPGGSAYNATKHAVVTLSETVFHEFQDLQVTNVGISVLCPAFIPTGIAQSVRPGAFSETEVHEGLARKYAAGVVKAVASGKISADGIAEITFSAIEKNQFYIVPHKKILPLVTVRAEDISLERNPSIVPRPA